jgi:hypothetical protein
VEFVYVYWLGRTLLDVVRPPPLDTACVVGDTWIPEELLRTHQEQHLRERAETFARSLLPVDSVAVQARICAIRNYERITVDVSVVLYYRATAPTIEARAPPLTLYAPAARPEPHSVTRRLRWPTKTVG